MLDQLIEEPVPEQVDHLGRALEHAAVRGRIGSARVLGQQGAQLIEDQALRIRQAPADERSPDATVEAAA